MTRTRQRENAEFSATFLRYSLQPAPRLAGDCRESETSLADPVPKADRSRDQTWPAKREAGILLRGGPVVGRRPHKPKNAGSIPAPAITRRELESRP